MFETYHFEHPEDETRRVNVGVLGYVAAGLAGSLLCALESGLGRVVAALLPHLPHDVGPRRGDGVTSLLLPGTQQLVVLAIGVPALLVFQSMLHDRLIGRIYISRGWIVHST
jgi:hypothetical protein